MPNFFLFLAAALAAPSQAEPSGPGSRGLSCTGTDGEVRMFTVDVGANRWKEDGEEWTRIARIGEDMILLSRERGLFGDFRREERLDRSTLTLTILLRTGLIDEKRTYHCSVGTPFAGRPKL